MTDDTDERGEEYVARQRGGDHLPECMAGELPAHARCKKSCCLCICERLRACEARVRSSEFPLGVAVGKHDGFLAGHAAALDAGRKAVDDVRQQAPQPFGEFIYREVLPAIDALRGES